MVCTQNVFKNRDSWGTPPRISKRGDASPRLPDGDAHAHRNEVQVKYNIYTSPSK